MQTIFASLSPELNAILSKICEHVEVPAPKVNTGHESERLIEEIEKQNYPHALLKCPHLEEKGIGEDCVDCQFEQYQTYKSRYLDLKATKGEGHTHTLHSVFDYYHSLITQYRLTECDELLSAVYPVVLERGKWSIYYFMTIQALSFLRFKQGRYEESIKFFNEQIDAMGPNERIYENMALAYSRIQNNKEASNCYARAIKLLSQKPEAQDNLATLLLGLSTVLSETDEALAVLEAAMSMLKQQYNKPHSLMAKTLTAMGDLHLRRDDVMMAEKCFAEAVTIFIDTCGYETPLTSGAMNKHAKVLIQQGEPEKAADKYVEALSVWANVDNESFNSYDVAEALVAISTVHTSNNYLPDISDLLKELTDKVANNPSLATDVNALCLLKFMYELLIYKTDFAGAIYTCELFIKLLTQLDISQLGQLEDVREQLLVESTNVLQMLKTIRQD